MSEPFSGYRTSDHIVRPLKNFVSELRLLAESALKVRAMVPRRFQMALGTAGGLMILTSTVAIALPILLGKLVDTVQIAHSQGRSGKAMVGTAGIYLAGIASVVLM